MCVNTDCETPTNVTERETNFYTQTDEGDLSDPLLELFDHLCSFWTQLLYYHQEK